MATGSLSADGAPVVGIEVAGRSLDAVIDTGFDGGLQLPAGWLPVLNPPRRTVSHFQMPTGEVIEEYTYAVRIRLDGREIEADTLVLDSDDVLLGLESLQGCRLEINFVARTVVLERVSTPS